MKTASACFLALLLLCGCQAKERTEMEFSGNKTVTFVNAVRDADAWILPQTAANLKTTVWGTATVPKAKAVESRRVPLGEAGDGGLYIFRMINSYHMSIILTYFNFKIFVIIISFISF